MYKLTYEVWFDHLEDALDARPKFDQTPVGRVTSTSSIIEEPEPSLQGWV